MDDTQKLVSALDDLRSAVDMNSGIQEEQMITMRQLKSALQALAQEVLELREQQKELNG